MRIGEVGGLQAGLVQGAREKTLLSLASSYSTCVVNRMLYLGAQHPHFLFFFMQVFVLPLFSPGVSGRPHITPTPNWLKSMTTSHPRESV